MSDRGRRFDRRHDSGPRERRGAPPTPPQRARRPVLGAGLGAADFDGSPYHDLPPRRHARRVIPTEEERPATPRLKGRRLSREERRAIQERRKQALGLPPLPDPVRPATNGASHRPGARRVASRTIPRRGLWIGGLVVVVLTMVAFGAGRFFGAGQALTPTPTPTAQVVSFVPPPSPAVVVASPPPASPSPVAHRTPVPPKFNPHDGKRVVCLDPGHGGPDTGYTRQDDGTVPAMQEKDINLRYALDLRSRLEDDGIRVVMTRTDDVAVNRFGADVNGDGQTGPSGSIAGDLDELQARINVCNRANADLLVSLHVNGFPDASARGYETWYTGARPFADKSRYFAELVDSALTREMGQVGFDAPNRGAHDDISANVQNGPDTFNAKHYVLIGPEIVQNGKVLIRPSLMPGAILECGFISNDQDAAFLASAQGQNAIVTAYELAILQYFDKYPG